MAIIVRHKNTVYGLVADLSALATADSTESAARVAADDAEVTARDAAILVETNARIAAVSAEVTARDAAILVETNNRITAVTDEATARAAADTTLTTAVNARLKLDGTTAMTGDLQLGANEAFSSVSVPSAPTSLVTKAYADGIAAGFDPKQSVLVATTGPITLANTQTIDGIAVTAGKRVLVKDQVGATTNGIYDVVDGGAWTRSTDMDGTPASEVSGGNFTFVEQGTANVGATFSVVWPGTIALGTDPINWTQTSSPGAFSTLSSELNTTQAGAGLSTGGAYVVNGAANYIDTATSLANADDLLDAALKVVADGLATEITNRTTAVAGVASDLAAFITAQAATDAAQTTALQAYADAAATNGGSIPLLANHTVAANKIVLAHAPKNGLNGVMNFATVRYTDGSGVAYDAPVSVDVTDGTGKTFIIAVDTSGQWDGFSVQIQYLYVNV